MSKVVREDIDNLNTVVTVTLERADYEEKLNAELNKYRKQAQMKGFRKGKTPLSVVKKMYGKSVLGEVVNDLLQKEMGRFLTEEKIEFLGQPLPSEGHKPAELDIKNLEDYEFKFEMGLAPQFEVKGLSKDNEFIKYSVEIGDEEVEEKLEEGRRQLGERVATEEAIEEGDVIKLSLLELAGNEPKAEGVESETSVMVDRMTESLREKVLGLTKGDILEVNPFDLEDSTDEKYVRKYLLNLAEDDEREIGQTFQATIEEVIRMEKAELNQEFFDKYFGEDEVGNEEAARERIREVIAGSFDRQAEALLFRDFQDDLLEKNTMELPDAFLKRWIKFSNEKVNAGDIEKEYDHFARNLTWSLIRSKIVKQMDLKVEEQEIVEYFKDQIRGYFGGASFGDDDLIENMARRFMKDEKQVDKAYQELLTDQLFDAISEQVTIIPKPVSREEFEAIVKKATEESEKSEVSLLPTDEEE